MQRGKLTPNVALAAILSFTVFAAFAANDSASLVVKGRIVPPACDLKLSDSVVDFGDIHPGDLKWGEFTVLKDKNFNLSITCAAPSRVALNAVDNRRNTRVIPYGVDMAVGVPTTTNANYYLFGLGQTGTSKIGSFSLWSDSTYTVDGKNISRSAIYSINGGSSWDSFRTLFISTVLASSKKEGGEHPNIPHPFKTLSAKMNLRAAINKPSELDFTKELKLDGQINIQLTYL
ncbi:DUF1120 domain-containing protein [Serratia fonticola]|uniref:DUF1120 domain-containing protein n=1 Tax=Serratia fonticola TaxID=47917 RepID=UPI0024DEF1C0|nr:DUF1120 domain-containing protein [Serratia fonticola]MDK2375045.1 DUF1120 domain-containing protein [Serratia fonticola]